MKWKHRALVLRLLATLPGGDRVYQLLQNRVGRFHQEDFVERRILRQASLARAILDHGGQVEGARLLEVGTGWVPMVPLGFWICGAAEVSTFDLHRYLSPSLTRRCLRFLLGHRERLAEIWRGLCSADQLDAKLEVVERFADRPLELLRQAGVTVHAPADAARTGLMDGSIDVHYSANVLEHVTPAALAAIFREGRRLLVPEGLAVHHVDPSDHFVHSDPSISRINFLQLHEAEWRRYYDNRYSYLNRWHDSDYRRLFRQTSFCLLDFDCDFDGQAMELLEDGFPLAPPFREKSFDELCRKNLTYVLTPGERG